jgi:diguanylate cyclase (GGDEF)-like protein
MTVDVLPDALDAEREQIMARGLMDTCRLMSGGSFSAAVAVPLVGGWIAHLGGTSTSAILLWSAAVAAVSVGVGTLALLGLRRELAPNPSQWLRRMQLAMFVSGVVNSIGLLLVDPHRNGEVNPVWSISLMVFSSMLAVNMLIGFGIGSLYPLFCAPVVFAAIVSCARLGGSLGAVLAFGCCVYGVVILGINRVSGNAFRSSTELRLRNEALVGDLEAANQLLERRAHSDALTGLANRAGLWVEIDRRGPASAKSTVLFLDLDGFKPINDAFGHVAGDEVLRTVGRRLTSQVRDGDIVARMGGDEFVVIAYGLDSSTSEHFAQRVAKAIREPMSIFGETVSISAAIGVASHQPDANIETTLAEADKLMYAMKRSQRNVA